MSIQATGLDTGTRQGLDLVVMMDTSESMKAGGWLAACSASLQYVEQFCWIVCIRRISGRSIDHDPTRMDRYLLRHHLDARDRVCLVHFDATTQTTLHHPFMPATGGGQQQLEALLHANMASTSNAARMGFSEALLKCFG